MAGDTDEAVPGIVGEIQALRFGRDGFAWSGKTAGGMEETGSSGEG